jgi:rubrerythrin
MNNTDLNEQIDILLSEAMNSELEAEKFYENASIKAESKAGKKLFSELANFERNHYERIKNIIESRNKGKRIEKSVNQDVIVLGPEINGEFEPNKDEIVSVINIAIDAEKMAQERYRKIADMFKDEDGKNIFNDLALEESNHQRILEDEFYHLSNKGTIIWD